MMPHKIDKLPRIFINMALKLFASIEIPKAQVHYLKSVLRLKEGAHIRVFNGSDGDFLAKICELGKSTAQALLTEQLKEQDHSAPLKLAFCILKPQKLPFLLEKSVELGISKFIPIISDHVQNKALNIERAKKIILEATEQCERNFIPVIENPTPLGQFIQRSQEKIICGLERNFTIPSLKDAVSPHTLPLTVLTGPEGGFSEKEKELLLNTKGVHPCSLGNSILRAETASIYTISFIKALFCI